LESKISQELLSSPRPEAFFLSVGEDFIKASTTLKLSESEQQRINQAVWEALQPLAEKGEFFKGQLYSPQYCEIYGMSAAALVEFADHLKTIGIMPWQVAVEEPFIDDGLGIYLPKIGKRKKRPINFLDGKSFPKGIDFLKDQGYQQVYGVFPHVNLYHLLQLAHQEPRFFFASSSQALRFKPVPGIQLFDYDYGQAADLTPKPKTSAPLTGEWDSRWGEKYNESFKVHFSQMLEKMGQEGLLGDTVIDLGCGNFPVSYSLLPFCSEVVLVDKAQQVGQLKSSGFKVIVDDFDRLNLTQSLAETATSPTASCVILSDILNYSQDWQALLKKAITCLGPKGRIIICNRPGQGFSRLFSDDPPKNNLEIVSFLQQQGLTIDSVQDSAQVCGDREKGKPISRYSQMVLVAQT